MTSDNKLDAGGFSQLLKLFQIVLDVRKTPVVFNFVFKPIGFESVIRLTESGKDASGFSQLLKLSQSVLAVRRHSCRVQICILAYGL